LAIENTPQDFNDFRRCIIVLIVGRVEGVEGVFRLRVDEKTPVRSSLSVAVIVVDGKEEKFSHGWIKWLQNNASILDSILNHFKQLSDLR
jgi:hypothetical protein